MDLAQEGVRNDGSGYPYLTPLESLKSKLFFSSQDTADVIPLQLYCSMGSQLVLGWKENKVCAFTL